MKAAMGGEIEFKAYEQHQGELLPGFVGDALNPGNPVFFVDDAVEGMDLAAFEKRYSALGEHAFAPRMLLKLWLFGRSRASTAGARLHGGCTGTFASSTWPGIGRSSWVLARRAGMDAMSKPKGEPTAGAAALARGAQRVPPLRELAPGSRRALAFSELPGRELSDPVLLKR